VLQDNENYHSYAVLCQAQVSRPGRLTWPFTCEKKAWQEWKCVADSLVAVPAPALPHFRTSCLGHSSCHPDASLSGNSSPIPRFDSNSGGASIGAGFSGHGCFRCALQAFKGKFSVGLAHDKLHMRGNPREFGGLNRWYTFASEHQLRYRLHSWPSCH
jgi:hypothetical protein